MPPIISSGTLGLFRFWQFRFWQAWIQAWVERRRLAKLDADRLMEEHGPAAYEVAWTMAQEVGSGTLIDTRPDGHWDRVRNIIARRTYRPFWRSSDPLQ
jgi:hypothetical protein